MADADVGKYRDAFNQFTAALKAENVTKWTEAVTAFEKDQTNPDPYERSKSGTLHGISHEQHSLCS